MIAIQKIGKSFMGALKYNLKKLRHPDELLRAELLDTNFTSLDKAQISKEIDWVRSLRPKLNRYVYHTSLNFPVEDKLNNEKLLAIAHDYLKASGYTNNQYFIFRHHDAGHPHLHLLVNRITFDGEVVSDSNNYKKSEALLRRLERQYELSAVAPSTYTTKHIDNYTSKQQTVYTDIPIDSYIAKQQDSYSNNQLSERASTKDELEMMLRTGRASDKMVLQEKLKFLLSSGRVSNIAQLIREGETQGIGFLFNQASTGRVSGITYFHGNFKAKGQALGNRFKWTELIKVIGYEQERDYKAISQANDRTRSRYDSTTVSTDSIERGEIPDTAITANLSANDGGSTGQQTYRPDDDNGTTIFGDDPRVIDGLTANSGSENLPDYTQPDVEPQSATAPYYFDLNIDVTDDEDETYRRRRTRRSGR